MQNFILLLASVFISSAISAQDVNSRYEVKSGKIDMVSEIFGKEQSMIMYFDDYGLTEYTETEGEIMGFKVHNVQIKKEGYMYAIDLNLKTCKKTLIDTGNTAQNINFSHITQELIDDLKIEKKGTEEYLGRTCEKWIMDHQEMRMTGTFLVWKGISLKTEMIASGMVVRMSTKAIDIDSPLPEGIFDIPAGITMVE